MKVLLCTDGSIAAEKAARLLKLLQPDDDLDVTILGVHNEHAPTAAIFTSFERMEDLLGGSPVKRARVVRSGNFIQQVANAAREKPYQLVAVGENLKHFHVLWLLKSTTLGERLAHRLAIPLLVARNVPDKIAKVLVCIGAKGPIDITLRQAGEFIAKTGAGVGLLHVMSQLSLAHTAAEADLLDTGETSIQRATPEGKVLLHGVELFRNLGITNEIRPILRHGLVLDEVMAELREGRYDLLVIGSHHREGQSMRMEWMLEDVANDMLSVAPCSVLVV